MTDADFGDGWGEDLDDLIDDDNDDDHGTASGTASKPAVEVDGWGDDLDNLDDDDAGSRDQHRPLKTHVPAGEEVEIGWGDDDDNDLFSDAMEENPVAIRKGQPSEQVEQAFHELRSYVESLMILQPSINAVLQAEYNNPEKAAELLHYYTERPLLRQYTIDKELPRMDYQVILQHWQTGGDETITMVNNKQEIAQLFKLHQEIDLLVRCANQSLLADLLQVMTGPDGLVRPQYMATCLAESCQFTVRCSPGIPGGLVECSSHLVLSLPDPTGDRFPVAKLKVHILLGVPTDPNSTPPMIEYKLQTMDIVIPSMDKLRPTAHFLVESGLLDHPPTNSFFSDASHNSGGGSILDNDTFRDIFLQQSQNMLQSSTVGLKSAWKQIDSVAGFSSKMNMVQKILPSAGSSVLEAAMLEQEEFQIQLQAQQQQHHQQQRRVVTENISSDTVPVSYPPPNGEPNPRTQARPTSILGSFMGAIAKSVTLPEEDPYIYEQYTAGSQQAPPDSKIAFPRPAAAVAAPMSAPIIHLYRKDDNTKTIQQATGKSSPQQQASAQPAVPKTSLSHMTGPNLVPPTEPWRSQSEAPVPTPDPVHDPPARQYQPAENTSQVNADEDLGLDDGWGDEDIDLALDGDSVKDALGEAGVVELPSKLPASDTMATMLDPIRLDKLPNDSITATQALPSRYDADDDILDTRKRWVNPSPGPRYLCPVHS